MTARQVLGMGPAEMMAADVTGLQLSMAERQSEFPNVCKAGIPVVIDDPDPTVESSL